jgi:hypothetical protein
MMEDKLDGSSNFKFLEDKTSEEGLLWVIQKCDTMTTFFMKMSESENSQVPLEKSYQHPQVCICICIICIIIMRKIAGGRNLLAKFMDPEGSQCIQKNNTLEVKTPG